MLQAGSALRWSARFIQSSLLFDDPPFQNHPEASIPARTTNAAFKTFWIALPNPAPGPCYETADTQVPMCPRHPARKELNCGLSPVFFEASLRRVAA